ADPPHSSDDGTAPGEAAQHRKALSAAAIAKHVQDLHDDDIRWNATDAFHMLDTCFPAAQGPLEAALHSDDWQQRQLAAYLLAKHFDPQASIDPKFWEVLVEALADDDLPETIPNAQQATRILTDYGEPALPYLVRGLDAMDSQQHFLCACILAWRGETQARAKTIQILIEHLQDNDFDCDARLACHALYTLGPPVQPYLEAAWSDADAQARPLITLILDELVLPPNTWEESQRRRADLESMDFACDPFRRLPGDIEGLDIPRTPR
ncbi:MAG TPA: hypothetical protein PLJ12_15250, partial [Planctomycetota bacterium]|nr:hypothetical protein [Planctomycetota bacterium]